MSTDTTEQRATSPVPLEAAPGDPALVGGKAARLADLTRAGFDVPRGLVLPPDAVERAREDASTLDRLVDEVIASIGDGPLAVRSSAVAEDLDGASFAGQYETRLDVRGRAALAEAILDCRASADAERVATYANGRSHVPASATPMAVLVQQLVAADAAGVAFSADPVTGNRDAVLVSAVRGLGERLVSGAASPDEWAITGGVATARTQPERAIDESQALEVARLARQVEAYFGAPQDIEWAIAGGRLYLLQARPITTLTAATEGSVEADAPIPVPVEPPPGFWEREASHFPQPVSPMLRSTMLPLFEQSWAKIFGEAGALLEGLSAREIGGWVYMQTVPLGGKDGPPPPPAVMKLMTWLLPSLRKRVRTCVNAMREGLPWQWLDAWEREGRAATMRRNEELRAVDLVALDDAGVRAHLQSVHEHMWRAGETHFRLHAPHSLGVGDLVLGCGELLGWDEQQSLRLVNGVSEMSSAPAARLAEVAALAAARPLARALLEQRNATLADLEGTEPDVAAAVRGYLAEFGCRAMRYEVDDVTLEESPGLVLRLVADQLATGYDPVERAAALAADRREAETAARGALAGRPADLARFEVLLERGRRAYALREDQEFHTVSVPLALFRYALLEAGRRLAAQGRLAAPGDVMWLEWEEAVDAFDRGTSYQETVAHRRRERAWVLANPGPASFGPQPAPPPSMASFPPEVRHLHEVLFWAIEQSFAVPVTDHDADLLRGVPASAGSYTGTVRVVMDESQFNRIQPGDVLVCPITSPVWSVLFASIGALVTESGGVLSHPAIIAREYRLPAVVAVGGATSALRDGQTVTEDGTIGEVRVHAGS